MATFLQMRENLRLLTMGGLGLELNPGEDIYGTLLNRAHEDLVEAYDWSFRLTNQVFNSVAPRTEGTITVSPGSPVIIGNGTNFSPADKGSFIWIGGSSTTPLQIIDVSDPLIASLSAPYAGSVAIETSYILAPLYYTIEGGLEVLSIRSASVHLTKRLREEINDLDAIRTNHGGSPSVIWCPAPPSPNGSIAVELWPVPSDSRAYLVEYYQMAPRMVLDSDRPLVKSVVVEEKAIETACQMMFAQTGNVQWMNLAQSHHTAYAQALEEALDADSKRVAYRGRVTSPSPFVRGYDSSLTPLNSVYDE